MQKKIKNPEVAQVFKEYPPYFRKKILMLREIILNTARDIHQVGEIEETLKWGQPSYLPKKKNIGSTVRIHWLRSEPKQYGMYFNCNTRLIAQIKKKFGNIFVYEGKRGIIFNENDTVPTNQLQECVKMALTYHLNKNK